MERLKEDWGEVGETPAPTPFSILLVYLDRLLAADTPSLHLVSSISCPGRDGEGVHLCAPSIPFLPLGIKVHVNLRAERGAVDRLRFCVSLSYKELNPP